MNNFYIVNDFDKPDKKHIVIDIGDNRCEYIHPDLESWGWLNLDSDASTLVDFGFNIQEKDGTFYFNLENDSVIKYSDGNIRHWQGEKSFSIKIPTEEQ